MVTLTKRLLDFKGEFVRILFRTLTDIGTDYTGSSVTPLSRHCHIQSIHLPAHDTLRCVGGLAHTSHSTSTKLTPSSPQGIVLAARRKCNESFYYTPGPTPGGPKTLCSAKHFFAFKSPSIRMGDALIVAYFDTVSR
ncbi:uncharacterized protein LOC120904555 [Anopheles arabiensis]|uniref:uncharacterized protein LOC120904555 n=1 Tax=Anopheles arabiensis TaxID=7173 RepID=UPI001AADD22D|nr:uncharacterized protein LOC120904555 [Anopheles arabiensis]